MRLYLIVPALALVIAISAAGSDAERRTDIARSVAALAVLKPADR